MDKPELSTSIFQPSDGHLYKKAGKAIATLALLIVISSLSSHSFAASQGEWGRSSTATAKITLRILPRDHGDSVENVSYLDAEREAAKGHTAFQAYCGASSSFNRPSGLFTASMLHQPSQELNAELERLLRTGCPESSAAVRPNAPRISSDGDQLTVLISPV